MRAPMCYVLAVVLRISVFSVSMGFSIKSMSTSVPLASLNRPISRPLVGHPHHPGDPGLFDGVKYDLHTTLGRVAGLSAGVEATPGTFLES